MNENTWSFVVVVVVVALLTTCMLLAGGLVGGVWGLALVFFLAYVRLTSFYALKGNQMLRSFCIGSQLRTFLTRTYANQTDLRGRQMKDCGKTSLGLFDLDIVLLLYPIWHGTIVPTTKLKLRVHLTDVFSSDDVPVLLDTTMLITLSPELDYLFTKVPELAEDNDLSRECTIHDNLYEETAEDLKKEGKSINDPTLGRHTYQGNRIAEILLRVGESAILESSRSIASKMKEKDIRGGLENFETEVLKVLSRRESVFSEAKLLDIGQLGVLDPATGGTVGVYYGVAVSAIDFNAEKALPTQEIIDAMSKRRAAELNKETAKLDGEGEGARLQAIAAATGADGDEVYRGSVIQKVSNVELIGAGNSFASLVAGVFGKAVKRPKKGP